MKPCRSLFFVTCIRLLFLVDGVWEEWTSWGDCDATCGNGNRWRFRTCVPPKYGGLDCNGPSNSSQPCFIDCAGKKGQRKPFHSVLSPILYLNSPILYLTLTNSCFFKRDKAFSCKTARPSFPMRG